MANRFLETNYYKSPFVRGLKGALKGLYSFIICDCSPSGIWAKDLEAASMYTGFPQSEEDFEEKFVSTGKAILISVNRYFFPDFIEHQYPSGLSTNNKAHTKTIEELKKLSLIDDAKTVKGKDKKGNDFYTYFSISKKGALKGLSSSYGNGQGNGIGKEYGKEDISESKILDENYLVPKMFSVFKEILPKYPGSIQKDLKPLRSIADFIHEQNNLNATIIHHSKFIIQEWRKLCEVIKDDNFYKTKSLSTISNQIQELYQISKNGRQETRIHKRHSSGAIYGQTKKHGDHAAGL